uniref:Immediate early response 3-interacting protein 1 n=1 Tax=Serinus canaria TaxID=9135 RepID=A0A8C9UHQ5_SERCA
FIFNCFTLLRAAPRSVCVCLFLCDPVGWGSDQGIGGFGEEPGIKAQLTNLIRSIRTVMRVPLIALNSITIILLLLFG